MRRKNWLLPSSIALVTMFALGAAACSSSSTKSASTATTTTGRTTTSTVASTTTPTPRTLPPGTQPLRTGPLPPGTYQASAFTVPFNVTTTKAWSGIFNGSSVTWLGRGLDARGATIDFVNSAEVVVTSGAVRGSTLLETINNAHEGCSVYGPPHQSTLMGSPALVIGGVTTTFSCGTSIEVNGLQLTTPDLSTSRVIAADVAGRIVVVYADAPTSAWATFRPELDALLASMKRAT